MSFFLCRPRHFRDICQNLMDRKWLYKKWSTRKTYFRSFKLFCSARAVFSFYQGQMLCAALLKIEKNTFCLKTNLCQNGSKRIYDNLCFPVCEKYNTIYRRLSRFSWSSFKGPLWMTHNTTPDGLNWLWAAAHSRFNEVTIR